MAARISFSVSLSSRPTKLISTQSHRDMSNVTSNTGLPCKINPCIVQNVHMHHTNRLHRNLLDIHKLASSWPYLPVKWLEVSYNTVLHSLSENNDTKALIFNAQDLCSCNQHNMVQWESFKDKKLCKFVNSVPPVKVFSVDILPNVE